MSKYACLVCSKPTVGDLCSDECTEKWFHGQNDGQMELAVRGRKTDPEDAAGSTTAPPPSPRGQLKLA